MIPAFIKSSIVVLAALSILPLLRRQSAATRHAVLTIALVGALIVPPLSSVVPAWHFSANVWPVNDAAPGFDRPAADAGGDAAVVSAPQREPLPLSAIALAIWLGGVGSAALVMLAGASRIAWLVFQSRSRANREWPGAAGRIAQGIRLKRRIRILKNEHGLLGTWGVLRPRILLPRDADNWSEDRLRVVLTHELAHIKRLDWLVQMLAEVARAFYWFNPLFWLVCRSLRTESEHACDDVVLNQGIDAKDYAAHLLEIARTSRNYGRAWSPVLAMAQPPGLERRFVAMLNPLVNHRSASRAGVVVVCVLTACLALPLAAMRTEEQPRRSLATPAVLVTASAPVPKRIEPPAPRAAARKAPAPKPPAVQGLADGSLSGIISDVSGAVIPGVKVTVSSMVRTAEGVAETPVQTAIARDAGDFEFRALTPGQYSLKAELPGFIAFRKPGLQIEPSKALHENVTLLVGNISEKVTVTAAGQPRPRPAGTPQRIRVGGNVVAANLIHQVKPVYPESARDAGIEGVVHLQAVIGIDGTLAIVRIMGKNPDLTSAALESVKQWRYRPTQLNGEPLEVLTDIDVEFKLEQ
jgi:TonB family protein